MITVSKLCFYGEDIEHFRTSPTLTVEYENGRFTIWADRTYDAIQLDGNQMRELSNFVFNVLQEDYS